MSVEGLEAPRWWRVEVNKAGSITDCEAVEYCHRNTRAVLYIRAVCREHALLEATHWLERRREAQRAYEKTRRLDRKKRGLCIACSSKISKRSSEFCASHLASRRDYQRARKLRQDAPPIAQPVNPIEVKARDTARHQRYRRMGVQLPVILAVFDQIDGRLTSQFRHWLVDEIAQRSGEHAEAAE